MSTLAPRTFEVARGELDRVAGSGGPGAGSGGPQQLHGRLEEGDEVRDDGKLVDTYQLRLGGGGRLTVLMDSGDFDTWLRVVSPSGRVFENDDRPGGGLNSGVEIDLSDGGQWTIEATSYGAGATGAYVITLRPPE